MIMLEVLGLVGVLTVPAHDVYTTLRSRTGILCCTGRDCEAVNYRLQPNGDVLVFSARNNAVIRVPQNMIVWSPIPGSPHEAHWCGAKTRPMLGDIYPPVLLGEADPSYVTYCAYIDPGGS
ncbi:hypothetical protein WDZ92_28310 [Nostoc sp. NIES-2111]